ncbi:MAG TPA: deoxyhypusine synthase family protein [Dehalococcoidia bacterium]|nr:deoxyhypusine synthase family protein [Dehalococcoidia bacterium]
MSDSRHHAGQAAGHAVMAAGGPHFGGTHDRHDALLHTHVRPFRIRDKLSAAEILEGMAGTSFQARNLAQAARIWRRMLEDGATVFFGLAGAMVPAGMRDVIRYVIENRMVDVIVSTGANMFHDVYETLGSPHWQSAPGGMDIELGRRRINRFYDVLAPESDFADAEEFVVAFAHTLEADKPITTREYFQRLGEALAPVAKQEGILTAAAKAGVPIYSPAIGDSVHGLAVTTARMRTGHRLIFDVIGDVMETSHIALKAEQTGVIYVGGGTPKNFIQQAEVAAYIYGEEVPGHKYGVQITMDQPQWGGLSGCTFEEAQSWRKIAPDADFVTVNVEATVALPLLVSGLAEQLGDVRSWRRLPSLDFGPAAAGR